MAVIDLAEACNMFDEKTESDQKVNYKATGVCYNNIANYHFKNGKFDLAAQTFQIAIKQADLFIEKERSSIEELVAKSKNPKKEIQSDTLSMLQSVTKYYSKIYAHR